MAEASGYERAWEAKASQRPALLVIVRHGQSERNTFDIHAGIDKLPQEMASTPDHASPLTDAGRDQARKTGVGLREEFGAFDAIYHSPWLRTTETTELLLEAFP